MFAQSRLSTEILTTYLKDDFENVPGAPERIRGYRGGYLPNRRREIEKGLRDGQVRAVVSTNALELGIDIGALDVSVMAGYPGHDCRHLAARRPRRPPRQSIGGGARRVAARRSISSSCRNPSYFFDRSPERALIDPDNLHILVDHVKCAAFELPFSAARAVRPIRRAGGARRCSRSRGSSTASGRSARADDAGDTPDEGAWTWTSESYPADAVSLRSVSSDNFVVVDTTHEPRVIGETDFTSGPSTLHPKAIYIVEGEAVSGRDGSISTDARRSSGRSIATTTRTRSPTRASPSSIRSRARRKPRSVRRPRAHGEVHVVSRVVGFKKIKFYTNENVGSGELDLPEQQMHTTSYWLTIPAAVMAMLPYAADDRRDGIVGPGVRAAAGRAAAADVRSTRHRHLDRHREHRSGSAGRAPSPRLFIYDNYPGGIGFSQPLFRMHDELLENTRRLIAECECENGCPGCVGPIGNTGPLAKAAALRILALLLGGPCSGRTCPQVSRRSLSDRIRGIVTPAGSHSPRGVRRPVPVE